MTLKGHIATLLYVTWRFLLEGDKALKLLQPSGRTVIQSFSALLFAFPVFALVTWLQVRTPGWEGFGFFHILGLFIGYALAWVGYAFLIFHAWAVVGHRHDYLYFMPVYNWGRVFALIAVVPFFALESFGVITGNVEIAVMVFSLAAVLTWKLSIIRGTLGANLFHGILFVLFDVTMVMLFDALIYRLYSAFI